MYWAVIELFKENPSRSFLAIIAGSLKCDILDNQRFELVAEFFNTCGIFQ